MTAEDGRPGRTFVGELKAPRGISVARDLWLPDDLKVRSCATLFATVSPPGSVLHRLLDRYFQGEPDVRTLELLGLDDSREQSPRPSG